jgi:succinoglycan biosynthesis protein ExoW
MSSVFVVIPYFQRASQPLARALASIASQRHVTPPSILIVDDASPYPAEQVVAEYFSGYPDLRIIKQANAGASSARNTGLDNIPDSADFVAFLDSDDEWAPDHLSRATEALDGHCDFYFTDHKRSDWTQSKFAMTGFRADKHLSINLDSGFYLYQGDPFLSILRDHVIQTSTVVVRWSIVSKLRFRTDLILGEDELYWIEAIRNSGRVGFSTDIAVQLGKGVNISQNAEQSSLKEAALVAQNLYFWNKLPSYLPGEPGIMPLRRERIRQLNGNYADCILQCVKQGQLVPLRSLLQVTFSNTAWLIDLNQKVFHSMKKKLGMGR